MSIGRAFYCDGPDCERHTAPIATPEPYLPYGFLEVRESCNLGDERRQFCGWECVMKYAAAQPMEEVIPLHDPPEQP